MTSDVFQPLHLWSPNPNSTIISYVLLITEICDGLAVPSISFGAAVLSLKYSILLFSELFTLNWSMKNLNKRAQNHYGLIKNDVSFENQYWSLNDSLVHALKQNIKHFIEIKKFATVFFDLIDQYLFLALWILSTSIGFSMIAFVSGSDHPGKILNGVCILVTQIFFISFFCLLGQLILNESERLRDTIYEVNWIDYDTKVRRMIITMQLMFNIPIRMTIGKGILHIDFTALLRVLNSAYSFFNILRAMHEF